MGHNFVNLEHEFLVQTLLIIQSILELAKKGRAIKVQQNLYTIFSHQIGTVDTRFESHKNKNKNKNGLTGHQLHQLWPHL